MASRHRHGAVGRRSAWLLACLAVGITQGCARPDAFRRPESNTGTSGGQKLPFHQSAEHAADDRDRPAVPPDQKVAKTPFRGNSNLRVLPAGTLITVQLRNSFLIAKTHPGDSFTASVVGPVVLDGETLIDSGAAASGFVESSQPPVEGLVASPALVRLTLKSIDLGGRSLALQTSSLFAKGTVSANALPRAPGHKGADYQLLKGRELTFRLTTPVAVNDLNSVAERQYPDSSK